MDPVKLPRMWWRCGADCSHWHGWVESLTVAHSGTWVQVQKFDETLSQAATRLAERWHTADLMGVGVKDLQQARAGCRRVVVCIGAA